MSQVDRIMDQVADLSEDEKRELRIRLLDEPDPVDPDEVARAWGEEIARRIEDFKAGREEAVPASEALRRMDEALAKLRA